MLAVIGKEKADKLDSILRSSRNAAIVVHTRPDGDALGSGIAMRRYLSEKRGLQATLSSRTPFPTPCVSSRTASPS